MLPDRCANGEQMRCPKCKSEAFYRYGRTKHGKQRFRCLICERQFTEDSQEVEPSGRPLCPLCGSKMHIYRKEEGAIRLRCSGYPVCRSFVKIRVEEKR